MQWYRRGSRLLLALLAPIALAAARGLSAEPAATARPSGALLGSPWFIAPGGASGLPAAAISCIAKDSQGFLWLGTRAGLFRYGGVSTKPFARDPSDRDSLPGDDVRALRVEGKFVWVGTQGGLAKLDLATEKAVAFPLRSVSSIARDGRGRLWAGAASGLYLLEETGGGFSRFSLGSTGPGSSPRPTAMVLAVDREGRLWIGGAGAWLSRLDADRGSLVSYRAPGTATAMAEDPSGKLWVGFAGGGVAPFDPSTGRFGASSLPGDSVSSLEVAADGRVFAGTRGGGLVVLYPSSGRVERYRSTGRAGGLLDDEVDSLFLDPAGYLWIGTARGLCALGRESRGWGTIALGAGGAAGDALAILEDRGGRLWVGTRGEGIAGRDASGGAWRYYSPGQGPTASPRRGRVDFLRQDARGIVWAGLEGTLLRYDPGQDRFLEASVPAPPPPAGPAIGRVVAMADDPSGGCWLGTDGGGLVYWDISAGRSAAYRRDDSRRDSLPDDSVTALGRDSGGRLWIGTRRGLSRLAGGRAGAAGKAGFISYRFDPANHRGLLSDSISAIFLGSRGDLWIGTAGGGAARYEPETDSFAPFSARDGLKSNEVLGLAEAGGGDLWIATPSGLAVYLRASGRVRKVGTPGAGTLAFAPGVCAASDGSLLFGSSAGILRFEASGFSADDLRPAVVLTSASSGGGFYLGAGALAGLESLALPRGEGSASFEFSALDLADPEGGLYSFKLEGFDRDWSVPGVAHRADYTNLPSGRYVFRVKAANGDGLWNEEGISLGLRVRRLPWASPPALAAYALVLLAAGYSVARRLLASSLSALRGENERLRAKLVAASAAIESAAIVDPLTGLPNKRKIEEHLELAVSRAERSKLELAVLMIDIDLFKSYNDRFGRAAGDECLRSVAQAIASCVRRSSDVVARFGGEEFLVVMEKTSVVGALSEAEAIRRAVEASGAVTVSVGCASAEPDGECSPESLVAAAEKALMAAKMLGRNRTSV